jgi:glycosyltransferase involved in cell wall biosynthesis
MRVLHLSKYDSRGGAAIAALNSAMSQRAAGIDARLAVGRKLGEMDFVEGPGALGRAKAAASFALERLPFRALGIPAADVRSIGIGGLDVAGIVRRHDPDVVVLHGVDGFVPLAALPNIHRPIVWRMHDMWPALGTRHYAADDAPLTGLAGSLDRWTFERKRRVYAAHANLTFCPPSQWLGSVARSSALTRGHKCTVIPNGVDAKLFDVGDKRAARAEFGLDPDALVVVFGAIGGTDDPRKGADLLLGALRSGRSLFQDRGVEFLFFGGRGPDEIDGVKLMSAGAIASRERMAMVYRAADLVIVPSRMENLSLTVLEAMACGAPVVAFDIGGMPDMIEPGVNGWLAPDVTSEALLDTIVGALDRVAGEPGIAKAPRRTIETRFTLEKEAEAMIDLYQRLLAGDVPDRRPDVMQGSS